MSPEGDTGSSGGNGAGIAWDKPFRVAKEIKNEKCQKDQNGRGNIPMQEESYAAQDQQGQSEVVSLFDHAS